MEVKRNQSPTIRFQRKKKMDALKRIDSPTIKKTASPLKRNILVSKRMSKMTNECLTVNKEKSLRCKERKRKETVHNPQRTLKDFWGPEGFKKKGPEPDKEYEH